MKKEFGGREIPHHFYTRETSPRIKGDLPEPYSSFMFLFQFGLVSLLNLVFIGFAIVCLWIGFWTGTIFLGGLIFLTTKALLYSIAYLPKNRRT